MLPRTFSRESSITAPVYTKILQPVSKWNPAWVTDVNTRTQAQAVNGSIVHKVVIPREEPLVYRAAGMGNWEPQWMARDGPQYKKNELFSSGKLN